MPPQLKASKVRRDFEKIWKQNLQQVYFTRSVSPMAGEYFHETDSDAKIKYLVEANIQGTNSKYGTMKDFGTLEAGTFKVYMRYEARVIKMIYDGVEVSKTTDTINPVAPHWEIEFLDGRRFRITPESVNESFIQGLVGFVEFSIVQIKGLTTNQLYPLE